MTLWLPLATLSVTSVGLYDDARFPGRCLVVLKDHVESLEDVDDATMAAATRDLRLLATALKSVTGSRRLNYAVLGNAEPHVHWHVIPRHPEREALPQRSPWDDPRPREKLQPAEREELMTQLKDALGS